MRIQTLILAAAVLAVAGCGSMRQAPGRATVRAGGVEAAAVQSSDPKTPTVQTVESETITRPGSLSFVPITQGEAGPVFVFTNCGEIITRHKVSTTIGAAQKNTAAEVAAKLASVRWLQWLGAVVALFGVASLVYPPLRLIVASVTTSAACIVSGAAMMFLPLVIVGNEVLILAIAGGAVVFWFFAHRHGELKGEVKTLKNYGKNQA